MAEGVDRIGAGSADDECSEAGEVEEIAFVAGRAELGAGGSDGDEFDGGEAEWKMDGEDGDEKDGGERDAGQSYECAEQDGEAAENFRGDGEPGHEVGHRHGEGVEDGGESVRAAMKFGVAVLHESEANDEAEGDGSPRGERKLIAKGLGCVL